MTDIKSDDIKLLVSADFKEKTINEVLQSCIDKVLEFESLEKLHDNLYKLSMKYLLKDKLHKI